MAHRLRLEPSGALELAAAAEASIEPAGSLTFRYRLLIAVGTPTKTSLERIFEDFGGFWAGDGPDAGPAFGIARQRRNSAIVCDTNAC